jgi:dibenzofuran dioxygenase beta subunit
MVEAALQHEVEQFLFHEAALLDGRRFDEWLTLFTDDATYLSPILPIHQAPQAIPLDEGLGIFNEDRRFLEMRIERLKTRYAHAEQPPSRTRHLLSNVRISAAGNAGNLEVAANFIVFQSRLEDTEAFFVGARKDTLVRIGAGWQIACRRILFDHRTLPRALSVLI